MKKIVFFLLGLHCFARGFAQVELQSGSAVFSLPMFQWQDDKSRLQTLLGLNYTSRGGLRVDDIPSNVGQGWDLVGGGVITRTQVGEPDDQLIEEGNGTTSDINKYPPGYLYNPVDAGLGCPNQLGYFPIFGGANTVYKQHNDIAADREQDYFTAQFNGRSVQFVLDKNNGDVGRSLGSTNLRISYTRDPVGMANQHIRTTITTFNIQDENGLVYTFSQLGLAKVLRMHNSLPNPASGVLDQPNYADGGIYCQTYFDEIPLSYSPWIVTSWHLTSITDLLTHRTVTFNYTVRNFNNYAGDDISAHNSMGFSNQNATLVSKTYIVITKNISVTQTPFLASIQCPDGYHVDLNYDQNNPRIDLPGDLPLNEVDISYNGRKKAGYLLNTSYFIFTRMGMPTTDDERAAARLCLRSVTRIGVDGADNEPPHVFDYYMGDPGSTDNFVPPLFYYTRDIFGYYNGSSANALVSSGPAMPIITTNITNMTATEFFFLNFTQLKALCFLGNNPSAQVNFTGSPLNFNTIHPGYAQNGLLKTITYPSGSSITYMYEQNGYSRMVDKTTVSLATNTTTKVFNSAYVGGVHVSQISQTDGGYSNSGTNAIVTTYRYTNAAGTGSSQWGNEDPVNQGGQSYNFALDGGHTNVFGGCHYDYQYPGISYRDQAYSVNDNNKTLVALMRITKAITITATLTMDIVNLAAGAVDPEILIFDVVFDLIEFLSNDCNLAVAIGFEYIFQNSDLLLTNSFPAQFNRVEVVSGNGGPMNNSAPNGKTVYEFTDFTDYGLWDNVRADAFHFSSRKQRAAFWAYGLPKRTTIYDAGGNIVKQTENKYDFSNTQSPAVPTSSCNCEVGNANSQRSDTWTSYGNAANLSYSTTDYVGENTSLLTIVTVSPNLYQIYTGRTVLSDTYERSYRQNDQTRYVETHSHFDYNPNNFQTAKMTVTQSNGDQKIKEIYYPVDYTVSGALATLIGHNIVNEPVATYNSIIKANTTTPVYTSASVAQFAVIPNGDVRATTSYTGRSTQPVTGWAFDPTSPNNYPNLVVTGSLGYDASGNLVRTQDEGGRTNTNIFDYNNKNIVATVYNADPNVDQSAYTSFETDAGGGWTIDGTPSYSTLSVTGGRGFNLNARTLSPNDISTNITFNKPYILSFWAYQFSNVVVGTALTLTKSGPTINGFTYYEYSVPGGTEGLGIHGNATIDELRLYPADAQLKSVTYDPLVGKTSDCDANNRITYYEYDALGRLRFVKDESRNIVKMYEYNQRQPGSVTGSSIPVTYTGPIYARLDVENETGDANGDGFGDLVIHFYSDAAGTQSIYVNRLQVHIQQTIECDNGGPISSQPDNQIISGMDVTLISQGMFSQVATWQDEAGNQYPTTCSTTFVLLPGAGYTVLQ